MEARMDDERFLVSGWEDDFDDIDNSRNPSEIDQRQILEAAENGQLEVIKELLSANSSLVHVTDKDGYTPLHRACYANHLEVVKYLIEKGANILAKTEMQWEPLHSCCQWNNVECAAFLIQCGADVNALSEGGQTPLHVAATHGANYNMVQLLLMHPYINPYLKNNSGEMAADIARRSSKYYNIFDMVDPVLDVKNLEFDKASKMALWPGVPNVSVQIQRDDNQAHIQLSKGQLAGSQGQQQEIQTENPEAKLGTVLEDHWRLYSETREQS